MAFLVDREMFKFWSNIIKYDRGGEAFDIAKESEIILPVMPTENVR